MILSKQGLLNIVHGPFNYGQQKTGVEKAPAVLTDSESFQSVIRDIKVTHWDSANQTNLHLSQLQNDGDQLWRNPSKVGMAAEAVYAETLRARMQSKDKLLITFGGDHSIAIGTVSATTANFGIDNVLVLWIDAHADINTRQTTMSGNIHGCPVSFLIGHADSPYQESFSWLAQAASKARRESKDPTRLQCLDPKNLVFIGLRDVEKEEMNILSQYGIKCYFMKEIIKRRNHVNGESVITKIFNEIIAELDPMEEKKIHISFDVDGIDPSFMPATGTPVPDGLTLEEGRQIIIDARKTNRLVSLDIVEVNPEIGSQQEQATTIANVGELIRAAIQ